MYTLFDFSTDTLSDPLRLCPLDCLSQSLDLLQRLPQQTPLTASSSTFRSANPRIPRKWSHGHLLPARQQGFDLFEWAAFRGRRHRVRWRRQTQNPDGVVSAGCRAQEVPRSGAIREERGEGSFATKRPSTEARSVSNWGRTSRDPRAHNTFDGRNRVEQLCLRRGFDRNI